MKARYAIADARRLHKLQWSIGQYKAAEDLTVEGKRWISANQMLEIFRLRSKYISERGATLNNPHITKAHLARFLGTDREVNSNWAQHVRSIAGSFAEGHEAHPAVMLST